MEQLAELKDLVVKLGGNLEQISARLDSLGLAVDRINERIGAPADSDSFLLPKNAAKRLRINTQTLYKRIRAGEYIPQTEVIDMSPEGSQRPAYRVNADAILRRFSGVPPK